MGELLAEGGDENKASFCFPTRHTVLLHYWQQDGECESAQKILPQLPPLQEYLDELLIPAEPGEFQESWQSNVLHCSAK